MGKTLDNLRYHAHRHFDYLWRSGIMERSQAYLWLGIKLGKHGPERHISKLNSKECKKLIEYCDKIINGK